MECIKYNTKFIIFMEGPFMTKYLSLRDHAYNYISKKIANGSLSPEEKVNEQQICNDLNLSRTPVREALIQLSSEGYLEKLPRRGFIVKHIDTKKAADLYTIIGSLDGLAAYLAMDKINDQDIERMTYYVDAMNSAIQKHLLDEYHQHQIAFHKIYINKCENAELVKLLNQLKSSFFRETYTSNNENIFETLLRTNAEHEEIVRLFKEKDANKARDYMQNVHFKQFSIYYRSSI